MSNLIATTIPSIASMMEEIANKTNKAVATKATPKEDWGHVKNLIADLTSDSPDAYHKASDFLANIEGHSALSIDAFGDVYSKTEEANWAVVSPAIEPEAEIIGLLYGAYSAAEYFLNDGMGDVGGATVALHKCYALYDQGGWAMIGAGALAVQVNVDAAKKVSTPQDTLALCKASNWHVGEDQMLSPNKEIKLLDRGQDPTGPLKKGISGLLGGRPQGHLTQWRLAAPGKRIAQGEWEAMNLSLPSYQGKHGLVPALDLHGSAVHVSWNMARAMYHHEFEKYIDDAVEVTVEEGQSEADAKAQAVGIGMIHAIAKARKEKVSISSLLPLEGWLHTPERKALDAYNRKVSSLLGRSSTEGMGADASDALMGTISAQLAEAAAKLRLDWADVNPMVAYSAIHWELISSWPKGVKQGKARSALLKALSHREGFMSKSLGNQGPELCDFLTAEMRQEIVDMGKGPGKAPEGITHEQKWEWKRDQLALDNPWKRLQRWVDTNKEAHKEAHGCSLTSCPDCQGQIKALLVGAVRSRKGKMSTGDQEVTKVASIMRKRMKALNELAKLEAHIDNEDKVTAAKLIAAQERVKATKAADKSSWDLFN